MRGGNANGGITAKYERPVEATLHVHLAHRDMTETFDNVVGIERILQEHDPEAPRG